MGQMVVRQLDDAKLARLRARAKAERTSVEALARDAIHQAAMPTAEEKLAIARKMQAWSRKAMVPGVKQTPGWELIREDRDHDH